jgi:hypothetical protein
LTKKLPQKARPAARRPSSKRPGLNEHDEPIVVDNFPVRVDFGQAVTHPTTPGPGPSWKRDFTSAFHQVIAIVQDEAGTRVRHAVRPVRADEITFDLVRESDPGEKVTLTFRLVGGVTGQTSVVMTPANETFVIENNQKGRLKPEKLGDLRLTKVTSPGMTPINLKPGSAFMKKVTVVIVGIPETR